MLLSEAGFDTDLARLLHEQGRLPLEQLLELLAEARGSRSEATLAERLVAEGLLTRHEVEHCLGEVRTRRPSHLPGVATWEPGSVVEGLRIVHEAEIYRARGYAYYQHGRVDEALEDLARALDTAEKDLGRAEALFIRAAIFIELERFDEAEQDTKQAGRLGGQPNRVEELPRLSATRRPKK